MPANYKVLGQIYPAANTETTLYTCGVISTVISSLLICNLSGSMDLVSVRICIANAVDTNAQLIISGMPIIGNSTMDLTAGLTVANTDTIKVVSVNGTCAFQIFGLENS